MIHTSSALIARTPSSIASRSAAQILDAGVPLGGGLTRIADERLEQHETAHHSPPPASAEQGEGAAACQVGMNETKPLRRREGPRARYGRKGMDRCTETLWERFWLDGVEYKVSLITLVAQPQLILYLG